MTPPELRKVSRAARKAALAVQERNEAIQAASAAGIPLRAIAAEAGLSHQRVHQIVHAIMAGSTEGVG